MHFSNGTLSLMVLVSLVLASFLTLVLAPAALRERRQRRRRRDPAGDRRLNALVVEQARSIQRLEAAVRQLALGQKQLGELAGEAVRHVAVVRFDAFEDMGGRLSFSAAILDGRGDGMVITSINGRQDTRVYAKAVSNGTSAHNLSDEEHQAIRLALGRKDRLVLAEAPVPRRVAEGGE
jgi:Protein of unknown function (DUF4446)